MPRKILVEIRDMPPELLRETAAENEAQLQEKVKAAPDLLPIEEFGLSGPALVIGRETVLPSGAVDLVLVTQAGELLIVEFKTGPHNPDFREALSQLLDYGSDIWGMSYTEFEQTVAVRFFMGDRCWDRQVKGKASLAEALAAFWKDLSYVDLAGFRDTLTARLSTGSFHYVVAAQRFTSTMERTLAYLNHSMRNSQFHAVEVVRFTGPDVNAFETRSLLRAGSSGSDGGRRTVEESTFLQSLPDELYRDAVRDLFEVCHGLGLLFDWGTAGTSIRIRTTEAAKPLSIAWAYPQGKSQWYGLKDLTLGYDPASAARWPSATAALRWYLEAVRALPGGRPSAGAKVEGVWFTPDVMVQVGPQLGEIIAQFVRRYSEADGSEADDALG